MIKPNTLYEMSGVLRPAFGAGRAGIPSGEAGDSCTQAAIAESPLAPAVYENTAQETMDCLKCKDLSEALESRRNQYVEARSSAYYQVSTELAAKKNVDMERAKYDMEEHHAVCASYAQRKLLG